MKLIDIAVDAAVGAGSWLVLTTVPIPIPTDLSQLVGFIALGLVIGFLWEILGAFLIRFSFSPLILGALFTIASFYGYYYGINEWHLNILFPFLFGLSTEQLLMLTGGIFGAALGLLGLIKR